MIHNRRTQIWLHVAAILGAVFIAYLHIFHAPFSTWDDDARVVSNPDIRCISLRNIGTWCTRFYVGDYQPMSMLGYALSYFIGGVGPFIYHAANIMLHALNAVILYFIVVQVCSSRATGLFTALIFALHPAQTESVSWIAEQQTVLCAFLFLLALQQYALYISTPRDYRLVLLVIFGIAAMLSKAIAVTLPVLIVAHHLVVYRSLRLKKLWVPVIILFAAALVAGITAIQGQAHDHWLNRHAIYSPWETVLLASYNYTDYIIHILVPANLSVMYPFPDSVGVAFYFYLLLTLLIITAGVVAWLRRQYILCGGLLFYTINIALLLEFLQYGEYMMADRFLYIAGIGIIVPMVHYPVQWLRKRRLAAAYVLYGGISLTLLAATFTRNNIWTSELNFVNSMVDQFPNSSVAQYSVGALYLKSGDFANAEAHINLAVQLDPKNYKAWYDRGVLCMREGKVTDALDALNRCLALHPYADAYFSRALLYMGTDKPDMALADVRQVLAAQPKNARAWYIQAYCTAQRGNNAEAIDGYTKAIALEPGEPLFYTHRGIAYAATKQYSTGITDMDSALLLDPNNGEALYYRGMIKYYMGQTPCSDIKAAAAKGYKIPADVMQKMCR